MSCVLWLCAVMALSVVLLTAQPVRRGFFCDDETIRYRYKPNTVTVSMLFIAIFLVAPTMASRENTVTVHKLIYPPLMSTPKCLSCSVLVTPTLSTISIFRRQTARNTIVITLKRKEIDLTYNTFYDSPARMFSVQDF